MESNGTDNGKRKLKVFLDQTLGETVFRIALFLHKKFGSPSPEKKVKIKEILLIKSGGIGDYLLAIPFFKKIRKEFPGAKVTVLICKRNKYCLQVYNDFDKVVVIDTLRGILNFITEIKQYDVCIDLDQHRKITAVLSLFSKAKKRIGFKHNQKELAYTHPIAYRGDEYEAQCFIDLLTPLIGQTFVSQEDLIQIHGSTRIKNSIGIYASAMKPENRLPFKDWRDIIKHKGSEYVYYFIGSKEDKERYDVLQAYLPEYNIVRMDGKLQLKESLDLVSTMELLISEDGGVYHMAVIANTPTISYWLHGEANMKKWSVRFPNNYAYLVEIEPSKSKELKGAFEGFNTLQS